MNCPGLVSVAGADAFLSYLLMFVTGMLLGSSSCSHAASENKIIKSPSLVPDIAILCNKVQSADPRAPTAVKRALIPPKMRIGRFGRSSLGCIAVGDHDAHPFRANKFDRTTGIIARCVVRFF